MKCSLFDTSGYFIKDGYQFVFERSIVYDLRIGRRLGTFTKLVKTYKDIEKVAIGCTFKKCETKIRIWFEPVNVL